MCALVWLYKIYFQIKKKRRKQIAEEEKIEQTSFRN